MNLPIKKIVGETPYEKRDSFDSFSSRLGREVISKQRERSRLLLQETMANANFTKNDQEILRLIFQELSKENSEERLFDITGMAAEEMTTLEDYQVTPYLIHRYRYEIHPKENRLTDNPPYLQIEPTSICNFRCIFCYQADKSFSDKRKGHMGNMGFSLFKQIVDQIEGEIEFLSLASRGEPLICPDIVHMLEYCEGKFLSLKINTNASLLTEETAHAILSGGVRTCVFSVDSADEELFKQLRVNGDLDQVKKKVELFYEIKEKHYPHSKLITRASGVYVDERQKIGSMREFWGGMVDQVTFVKYNPWENTYENKPTQIDSPCTDLWRRMFIWYDGTVNPCDCDYKSTLSVGNIANDSISDLWRSPAYSKLRKDHLSLARKSVEPCRRCFFV
ncbi:MAG: SPASM domain-containing protein [Magnetococcales bacterium]|nr:SPASM domain-containing protein [Magnetococcales bacterium]